jgi:hypothetical protein
LTFNYLDKVVDEPLERGEGTDHDDPRALPNLT